MGNSNYYEDVQFMKKYRQLQKQFRSETPLFDVEEMVFPLSTSGMKIVDAKGRRVKIAGGNWSGGHMKRHCVGGLDEKPLSDLCNDIRNKFDMNCIRLTFSLEMFYQNNKIQNQYLQANQDLFGKTALQIFDQTIQKITQTGLMVLLNNHTSKSQWCCSNFDGDGLWWNQQYSEDMFFNCLTQLAKRYKHNPRVIGMDLRNQIRRGNGLSPTWGDGDLQTDWHRAAQIAGNKILEVNPHWLIVVGGINYQLDLSGVMAHPIKLRIANKLVYSGHFYGFSWPLALWPLRSEEWFRQKLFNQQLYVRGLGVPFLLGEFGNNNQDTSWKYLYFYMRELDLDWTYWCLDGYKCQNKEDQTYGVWDYHFQGPRHTDLLNDMKRMGRPIRGLKK